MHGVATPHEYWGIPACEEFLHAHRAVLLESVSLTLVLISQLDLHAASAPITVESHFSSANATYPTFLAMIDLLLWTIIIKEFAYSAKVLCK